MTDFLHLHCGDCSADIQRKSSVPGDILVWREVYTEGRLSCDMPLEEWASMRAEYLFSRFNLPFALEGVRKSMISGYERVKTFPGEIVLWADPCLFDQTFLSHFLWFLRSAGRPSLSVSLVQIDDAFGFSKQDGPSMEALFRGRTPLSEPDLARASDLWRAFCSDTPELLPGFASSRSETMPFLSKAALRQLRQLPFARNGLDLLENEILEALATGPMDLPGLFRAVSGMEELPFFGDASLWALLDDLCRMDEPLLSASGPFPIRDLVSPGASKPAEKIVVSATGAGRRAASERGGGSLVMRGRPRWAGGVFLDRTHCPWFWDDTAGVLVRN